MCLADLFNSFLIDLDGVIYIGNTPTENAPQTVNKLFKRGKNIIFLTNDPRKSPSQYADKLAKIKINTTADKIITSATALSVYLKKRYDTFTKSAFVIGSNSLKNELSNIGLRLLSKNSDIKADFVIVGGNNKVDYNDLKKATLCIRDGAEFFATNNDPFYPTPIGLVPATGAIVAAIETASLTKAIIVGKPKKIMFDVAKSILKDQDKCAVIGDRLDTDILGGKRAGLKTILSLTGSTNIDEVRNSKIKPDYVIENLTYLFKDRKLSEIKFSKN
jgi:phosphoglycolate/pyridoxal phosphate phosphatase family enzyme